jgi:hypothetical protein
MESHGVESDTPSLDEPGRYRPFFESLMLFLITSPNQNSFRLLILQIDAPTFEELATLLSRIPVRSEEGRDREAFGDAWREQLENFDEDDLLYDRADCEYNDF